MSLVPRRYRKTCLTPFQCLQVREELYLLSRLTTKAMSSLLQFARYISASIALKYTSGPISSSSLS
ncbi:hypothetical protein Scep_004523 [Stephania cephalantha]|uniref:Uncharacterized protein n=1 Tax=Stephania cephalantha TaxID=152367 RepID=A0AAP0KVH4_9MAGN